MKIDRFVIVYDDPLGAYFGGQTISGSVILQVSENELKCDGIFLHCIGAANVHWSEQRGNSRKHYRNSESYFNFKVPLGQGNRKLFPPGQYTFPFSVTLPTNLPTSFEGKHGYIRYICKCNISRPWRFDPKTKMPFTVLSVADLNRIPSARDPVTMNKTKTFKTLFLKSGSITATISISKSGFVPGEFLFFSAHVDNESKKEIRRTSVYLCSTTTYRSRGGKTRTKTKELCQLNKGKIPPFGKEDWNNESMRIPAVPPSGLGGCRIITTVYFLKFTVDPIGLFTLDLDVKVLLTIGSIPLIDDFTFILPSTPQSPPQLQPNAAFKLPYEQMGNGATMSAPPPYTPPYMQTYPSMPPPSYEETIYGRSNITEEDDDEHTTGQRDFAPRYAYYQYTSNNQPSTS